MVCPYAFCPSLALILIHLLQPQDPWIVTMVQEEWLQSQDPRSIEDERENQTEGPNHLSKKDSFPFP